MRYLITGASGFIGRNLVKQLLSTNDDFELLLVQRDLPVFKDKRVTVKLLDLNDIKITYDIKRYPLGDP